MLTSTLTYQITVDANADPQTYVLPSFDYSRVHGDITSTTATINETFDLSGLGFTLNGQNGDFHDTSAGIVVLRDLTVDPSPSLNALPPASVTTILADSGSGTEFDAGLGNLACSTSGAATHCVNSGVGVPSSGAVTIKISAKGEAVIDFDLLVHQNIGVVGFGESEPGASYVAKFSGKSVISGTITESVTYTPKSTADYLSEYIADARTALRSSGNLNPTDFEVANKAWALLTANGREVDSHTSLSPELRDAEYALRGYIGGQVFAHPDLYATSDLNTLANSFGTFSWAVYSAVKLANDALGRSAANQSNPLPATPPFTGGLANFTGYQAGYAGVPIDSLPAEITADMTTLLPAGTLTAPLFPTIGTNPTGASGEAFVFDVSPGGSAFIDPALDQVFGSGNDPFASFEVFEPNGASCSLDLYVNDTMRTVQANSVIDLTTFGTPAAAFALLSAGDKGCAPEYTLGLSFTGAGREFVWAQALSGVTTSGAATAVAEPSSGSLIAPVVLALYMGRRLAGRRGRPLPHRI